MSYIPICAFCLAPIPDTERATEVQVGDRSQHLSLMCENCRQRSDRLRSPSTQPGGHQCLCTLIPR
jgi:hypothetical protein